jgi:hypothetical protein
MTKDGLEKLYKLHYSKGFYKEYVPVESSARIYAMLPSLKEERGHDTLDLKFDGSIEDLVKALDSNKKIPAGTKVNSYVIEGGITCDTARIDLSEEFEKGLEIIGATKDDEFYGFNTSLDEQVLTAYDIFFKRNAYKDLVEMLRLTTSNIEKSMAYEGSSIECCYFYITGQRPEFVHGSLEELLAIKEIFDFVNQYELREYYTVYPFGQNAGMPLDKYVIEYRRNADGYRYNNFDKLSDSLDHYIFDDGFDIDDDIDD